jgi:hypothetical protein
MDRAAAGPAAAGPDRCGYRGAPRRCRSIVRSGVVEDGRPGRVGRHGSRPLAVASKSCAVTYRRCPGDAQLRIAGKGPPVRIVSTVQQPSRRPGDPGRSFVVVGLAEVVALRVRGTAGAGQCVHGHRSPTARGWDDLRGGAPWGAVGRWPGHRGSPGACGSDAVPSGAASSATAAPGVASPPPLRLRTIMRRPLAPWRDRLGRCHLGGAELTAVEEADGEPGQVPRP